MTKKEAAIVSAYTGILIGSFSDMHEYIEEKLQRPVWTHEMGDAGIAKQIKESAKDDFISITITD